MGTRIRPELSEKNDYYLPKHRYYELKHFTMQYPDWLTARRELDGMPRNSPGFTEKVDGGKAVDPTAVYAESRLYYDTRIRMVEEAADMACGFDGGPPARGIRPLLMAILDEYSYEEMIALYSISVVRCTREKWYTAYRRYFWFLDKLRM